MALNTAHFNPLIRFILLTLLLVAALWPQAASAQDPATEVLNAINAARAENGLGPVATNALLTQAAQNHVNDMLTNYIYGHYGSDGSTVKMRVARTGYSQSPWVSENWVSASSASGAMRWWMGDYIHRVNILTGRWSEIGIGVGTRGNEMIFVTVFSAGGGADGGDVAIAEGAPEQAPPPPSVHIEQVSVPAEGLNYTVQSGDTLLAIGLRYGLPWERIAEVNELNERSLLQIGQIVRIPGSAPVAPAAPDVETEDYTVQPNDTLYSIAARRGMYWDEVAAVNGFSEHTILQIGQVIQVPVVEEEAAPEAAAAASAATDKVQVTSLVTQRRDMVGPVLPEQSAQNFSDYTLMQFDPNSASTSTGGPTGDSTQVAMAKSSATGDGMSDGPGAASAVLAAHAAQVETQATVAETEATVAEVKVEAEVAVETEVAAAAAESSAGTLYEVQPGDTIISIAIQHNLEWGTLLALNGLNENSVLQLGQMIRLR